MPTYTNEFNLYKPDLGQKDPNEWGTGVNGNFDSIDRLLFYRPFLYKWGLGKPQSPSIYDDEFDDGSLDPKWNIEDAGSGALTLTEDNFHRLKVTKTGGPAVQYLYQQLGSPIDPNTYPTVYLQIAQINNTADPTLEDTQVELGLFAGSSIDDKDFKLLVWTGIWSNLVRVYTGAISLDTSGKGTENYSYDYGRIPELYFLRIRADYDFIDADWDLMFQISSDGVHWKNLKLIQNAFIDFDMFGIVLADLQPAGSSEAYGSVFHFRFNYSVDPALYT